MVNLAAHYEAESYLDRSFEAKGVGGWRKLYLKFIAELAPSSVAELGAGSPDFLLQINAPRRIAVDVGMRFAPLFQQHGIQFAQRDLERHHLSEIGTVDVAICSDVFEHLVNPALALDHIADILAPGGILFSHVPNEYRISHVLRVMRGGSETVLFHKGHTEWEDPHFRRFSDIGFRAFLARRFRHNLPLADMRFGRGARLLKRLGFAVPYCMQGGPTYASTNDEAVYDHLRALKQRLAHG